MWLMWNVNNSNSKREERKRGEKKTEKKKKYSILDNRNSTPVQITVRILMLLWNVWLNYGDVLQAEKNTCKLLG